jgi:DNA-binding transcriptional LysR family regulator
LQYDSFEELPVIVQFLGVIVIALSRLHQVVSLAEHGNFRRAAASLQLSQPALTKNIQALEATLGVRLFDRQPGGVVPTEFGRLVVAHARDMLLAEDELLRQIRSLAGLETGTLNIALGPYPSMFSGYAAAGRLLARSPKLSLSLHVAGWREVTRAVAEREVDLGLAELTGALLDDTLVTEAVAEHGGHMVCSPSHPLLRKGRVTLADTLAYPWATVRIPPRLLGNLPRPIGAAGQIDPLTGDFVPAVEIDVPMQLARLVHGTEVLALTPLIAVEQDLASRALAVLPLNGLPLHTSYGFIRRRKRPVSPAMQAFMRELRAEEQSSTQHEADLAQLFAAQSMHRRR